jgi:hypothetical protein
MAPTLTAVRERTHNDMLEQDNTDVLSSRLNDIGDPTKWVDADEMTIWYEEYFAKFDKEHGYV